MNNKIHWDYVDIGTSDFDTSAVYAPASKILLVEPLDFYLNTFANLENVELCNCAVGAEDSEIDVYYLTEDKIKQYGLPDWLRGCNSVGRPHKLAEELFQTNNISMDELNVRKVPIITFRTLCERYNIGSIGTLKLDTEGHDHHILPEVFRFANFNEIYTIIVEYQEYAGNTGILDNWFKIFNTLGYEATKFTPIDYKLEKKK